MTDATVARRQTKGERTKERIIQAAFALFSEQGFATTSVRDIAARADITHVGLMHHFPSKDDLLLTLLEYREQQDVEELGRYVDGGDPVFAWTLEVLKQNIAHPDRVQLFVTLSAESTMDGHPAQAYFIRRYDRLVAALSNSFAARFVTSPPSYDVSPRDAAIELIALMDGLQVQWLLTPDAIDMHRIVRNYLNGLGVTLVAN